MRNTTTLATMRFLSMKGEVRAVTPRTTKQERHSQGKRVGAEGQTLQTTGNHESPVSDCTSNVYEFRTRWQTCPDYWIDRGHWVRHSGKAVVGRRFGHYQRTNAAAS